MHPCNSPFGRVDDYRRRAMSDGGEAVRRPGTDRQFPPGGWGGAPVGARYAPIARTIGSLSSGTLPWASKDFGP